MDQQRAFRRRVGAIADRPRPVLSVYLNVNPAHPENQARAYLLRLKGALEELGAPRDLVDRIRQVVELGRMGCRTLAIFATPDGLFETYRLGVDLPDAFRWNEAYVAPLMLLLEEYEPYGIALVDARKFRFLVTSLGRLEETLDETNPIDITGWREVTSSPSTANPGGGTLTDSFANRVDAHIHHFYKQAGESVRRAAFGEGVGRLILAGPSERVAEFRRALPRELQDRVVAEAHIPTNASEGVIVERLETVRERIEREREASLLTRARERGVRGLDATLAALQEENRVYQLLVLWELEGYIRWCDNDRLAIGDTARAECPYCGQRTHRRPLLEALIELAAARGARVESLRGENADALREELGGVAGLIRF
jgi:peptide subunit release factor 1 (eRF1)